MKIDAHVHIYETINGYGSRGELRPIGDGYARWANGDTVQLIPEGMGVYRFRRGRGSGISGRWRPAT